MASDTKRDINDVLHNRVDMSPFITHLTKDKDMDNDAKSVLSKIIMDKTLKQSGNTISPLSYGSEKYHDWDQIKKDNLLSAICFTETPLHEIHALLKIRKRKVNLTEYGLVFLRQKLILKNVSPVIYLNNYDNQVDEIMRALCDIVDQGEYNESFTRLFPLFSTIGYMIQARGCSHKTKYGTPIDFYWEREWRLPYVYEDLTIDPDDLFVGLCDESDIEYFENLTEEHFSKKIIFIDPKQNLNLYAKKLNQKVKELNEKEDVKIPIKF